MENLSINKESIHILTQYLCIGSETNVKNF